MNRHSIKLNTFVDVIEKNDCGIYKETAVKQLLVLANERL